MSQMSKIAIDDLLTTNPKAKKHEKLLREALAEIKKLRAEGFGGEGYRLVSPYGDKRQLKGSTGRLTDGTAKKAIK